MSSVERYAVSDTPDNWADGDLYDTYEEAKNAAFPGRCVTEITYEFSDTDLVDDFRPVHYRRRHQAGMACGEADRDRTTRVEEDVDCEQCCEWLANRPDPVQP